MKNIFKILSLVLVLVLAIGVLAACNDDKANDKGGNTTDTGNTDDGKDNTDDGKDGGFPVWIIIVIVVVIGGGVAAIFVFKKK